MSTKKTSTKKAVAKKTVAKPATKKTAKKEVVATKEKEAPLPKFNPSFDKQDLLRGSEFIHLRKAGMNFHEVSEMYAEKGIEVSAQTLYQAERIAKAPKEVIAAVNFGKVKVTSVLSLFSKSATDESIKAGLEDLIAQRENRKALLASAGFEGSSLTKTRTISMIKDGLEKLQKSKTLSDARGKVVLAFMEQLNEVQSQEDIKALIEGMKSSGTAKKKASAKKALAKA